MKKILSLCFLLMFSASVKGQLSVQNNRPEFSLNTNVLLTPPPEGLWSVSNQWKDDWPANWQHADAAEVQQAGEWTIFNGKLSFSGEELILRDSYREVRKGLVECIRRFEWQGKDTLRQVTLSVRMQMKGKELKAMLPGVLYYGNSMGAKVNPQIIPVYTGTPGEFVIVEDHRFPMPFVMLENAPEGFAGAIHTTPSPVRGAVLNDQWWSMGIEAYDGYSEFVLYSGPIGYNGQRSTAKSLQFNNMPYTNTYIDMEPGRIVEKRYYIELYPADREGTGFQQPVYTSMDLYKPYDAARFDDFLSIVKGKYTFAKSRWIHETNHSGFGMYDLNRRKDIVMGWCGQADSPGYALQVLGEWTGDAEMEKYVQPSLDYLTSYPVNEDGLFAVGYSLNDGKFYGGDHISCGQAMYNFSKAIETARKIQKYHTGKWEIFLREICDKQSKRILSEYWNPLSTAEGFYIAPLAIASVLFDSSRYKEAAIKAGELFAKRHLTMNGCYWGGTLDATCEDKEGAWAAFQGFLELYERFGDEKYLNWAKHAMDVCLTYVVVWDIPLPPGRMADYNFKTTGWTVVSPQNQHIDVYGVLFAPEVYKMGKYLRDERLIHLAKVMYRSCYQLTNPFGSQGEQLQQTNFAQQGDMSNVHKLRGGYSENWTVFWITAHFLNAAARFVEIDVIP